jgi:hypothetical protein
VAELLERPLATAADGNISQNSHRKIYPQSLEKPLIFPYLRGIFLPSRKIE